MALFPQKTPDEIVFGVFFLLAGLFFYRIFEMSPWLLRQLPRVSLVAGTGFMIFGVYKLFAKKEN